MPIAPFPMAKPTTSGRRSHASSPPSEELVGAMAGLGVGDNNSRPAFVGGFQSPRQKPLPPAPSPHRSPAIHPPQTAAPGAGVGGFRSPPPPRVRMPEPEHRRSSLTMQYAEMGVHMLHSPEGLRPPAALPQASSRPQSAPSIPVPAPATPPRHPATHTQQYQQHYKRPDPSPVAARPSKSNSAAAPTTPARRATRTPSSDSSDSTASTSAAIAGTPNGKVKKPRRKRTASTDDTPSAAGTPNGKGSKSKDVQRVACGGRTVKGDPCKNKVKVPDGDDLVDEDGSPIERFCHTHSKTIIEQKTFFSRKNGLPVTYADWIPDYLQTDTQIALRTEMEKARSNTDKDGYIYTFHILDPSDTDLVHLKVGRTVNLTQRIHQWSKQCGSKEQVLRGFWPGTVDPADGSADQGGSVTLMRGRVNAGPAGKWCHRLERLIHLELTDLARNAPYLSPSWPSAQAGVDKPGQTVLVPKPGGGPCPDCGAQHKEIFSFPRVRSGRYTNQEWDAIVKPVIEKWGIFVKEFVGPD